MSSENHDTPDICGEPDAETAMHELKRARAAVVCERHQEAELLLAGLRRATDRTVAARANMLSARLWHRSNPDEAAEMLNNVAAIQYDNVDGLTASLLLELARTWSTIGRPRQAIAAYQLVLEGIKDSGRDVRNSAGISALALAHYRLGRLFAEEKNIDRAYNHWRSAFEANSEDVLPYAAFALASEIGDKLFPPERIESMYMHAVRCDHFVLSLRARYRLADFLAARRQYDSARAHLEIVRELGDRLYRQRAEWRLTYLAIQIATARKQRQFQSIASFRLRSSTLLWKDEKGPRVVIVGAGTGGRYLLEALKLDDGPRPTLVRGFVDDDLSKIPPLGYPMLGGIADLKNIIEREPTDEVLMAIPTAPGKKRLCVVKACREANVPLRNLPAMHALLLGWDKTQPTLANQLQPVSIEETIGDDWVLLDEEAVAWVQGARVLVIGASGIGAELCRRLAHGTAESIAVLDSDERALQQVSNEISSRYDYQWLTLIQRDWEDADLLQREMTDFKPSLVIHTGGLASETLLDRDPFHAADRDLSTSCAVMKAAGMALVPHVLFVSDIRAGHPDSTFGAIKALVEEAVLSEARKHPQSGCAIVRTIPPMGTSGSTTEQIAMQIASGRPVTIPSEQATARFVSVARTAELTLHIARMMAQDGLTGHLVLSAGSIEKIEDVASEMILLRERISNMNKRVMYDSQMPTEPIDLCGEPVRGQREILVLKDERSLNDDAVEVLADRLSTLRRCADETKTLPVLIRDFALIVREYLYASATGGDDPQAPAIPYQATPLSP